MLVLPPKRKELGLKARPQRIAEDFSQLRYQASPDLKAIKGFLASRLRYS